MAKQVDLIMPKLKPKARKKVCAYARVSSSKDAMLHSLSYQVSYYSDYIQKHNDWEYVCVYVDEGISGTKDTRDNFNQMIEDAKNGRFEMIITKSISRFARNTVVFLETIRLLKELNIDVFFEEQNIHSLSGDGEFMLTILASYAQEESRSVSENMKWRIKKNFEEGKIWNVRVLGYRGENGQYKIKPEEAEVVKRIFDLYLSGLSIHKIVKVLNDENVKSMQGGRFCYSTVSQVLKNYNYTGNLILQKTYRLDHITKKTVDNKGQRPKYLVEGSHEPIVDLESFNKVQETIKAKAHPKSTSGRNNSYPFSSMIECDCCKSKYKRKVVYKNKHSWVCRNYSYYGAAACNSKSIREEILIECSCKVLEMDEFNEDFFKCQIEKIVSKDKTLFFHLKDGTIKEIDWEYKSRKDSWDDVMKEQARIKALIQHGKEGNDNGKNYSNTSNN